MNAERIFHEGKFLGIIHEAKGRWHVTLMTKNYFSSEYRTCGNGIVRQPTQRRNQCSEAKTWDTKEEALAFVFGPSCTVGRLCLAGKVCDE